MPGCESGGRGEGGGFRIQSGEKRDKDEGGRKTYAVAAGVGAVGQELSARSRRASYRGEDAR